METTMKFSLLSNNPGEEVQEGFVIGTPQKAELAVKQIKERQARRDIFLQLVKDEIAALEEQARKEADACEWENANLLEALDKWLDTVPCDKAKTQWSFKLPAGKVIRKLPKLDYAYDPDELLDYLKRSGDGYVQVTEKPKWGEFKKQLRMDSENGIVIRSDTGEALEVVTLVEIPGRIEVK